jgi:hypothetical protein
MPLNLVEPSELKVGDCPPHDFAETQVFYLGYGRNAWHSTWTNKYYPDYISFSELELKGIAERERKQGSVFKIQSMPMFVLMYQLETLGFCLINDRSQYEFNDLLDRINSDSIFKLFHHFPPSRQNWLLVFNLNPQEIPNLKYEEFAIKSVSLGRQNLFWEECAVQESRGFLEFCEHVLDRLTSTPEKQGRQTA